MEESPQYSPPKIVAGMRGFLSLPRNFNTDNFAKLVSSDKTEQRDYTYGLIFVSFLVGSIFLVWASTLLILKCMGRSVGCASGSMSVDSKSQKEVVADDTGSVESDLSGSDEFDENVEIESVQEDEEFKMRRRRTERRIRIAFTFACVSTVACCILAVIWAFSPIKEAVTTFDDTLTASQEIIDELNSSIRSIGDAIERVNTTLASASLDFNDYCPNVDPGPVLGADIKGLGNLIKEEMKEVENASRNITSANRTLNTIQDILNNVQTSLEATDDYLWIIPGVLAAVCILITVAVFGVTLACKESAGPRVQRGMAYGVLPLLIVLTVICWAITLGAGVSTMVSGDACVEGGNPDSTILDVMEENGMNSNRTLYKFVASYTGGCARDDPTEEIKGIQEMLSVKTKLIWTHVSIIDSIGREEVAAACGNNLDELMADARLVANSLTLIRQALSSAALSLKCDRINRIYMEAAYDSVCTKAAGGVAWGFLFFFLISVSMMLVISLRAAWYHGAPEEKVYDESEVADNMVLDEHEDYLNYISKYKHEWQDYNGISITSLEGLNEAEESSEYGKSALGIDRYAMEEEQQSDQNSPNTAPSVSIDEISFPSLVVPPGDSSQSSNSWMQYDVQSGVPPLLPPAMVSVTSNQGNDDRSVDTVRISLPEFVEDDKAPTVEAQAIDFSSADFIPLAPPLVHACIAERDAPEEANEEPAIEKRDVSPKGIKGQDAFKNNDAVLSCPDMDRKIAPSAPVTQSLVSSTSNNEDRDDGNIAQVRSESRDREATSRGDGSTNQCSRDTQGVAVLPCGHGENVEMTFETPRQLSLFEEEAQKGAFSFDFFEQNENQVAVSSADSIPSAPPLARACIAERVAPEEAKEDPALEKRDESPKRIEEQDVFNNNNAAKSCPDMVRKIAPSVPVSRSLVSFTSNNEDSDDGNIVQVRSESRDREATSRGDGSTNQRSRDTQGIAVLPCGHGENVEMTFETPRQLSLFEEEAQKGAFSFDLFEQNENQMPTTPPPPPPPPLLCEIHDYRSTCGKQPTTPKSSAPKLDCSLNASMCEPSRHYRSTLSSAERSNLTLSFADNKDEDDPGPVAQKVDLFTKEFGQPRIKPPTPGRKPKIKKTFFDME